MRKLLIVISALLFCVEFVQAQMKVVDFKLLESDQDANTYGTMKYDDNGDKAALIKIVTPAKDLNFDGGSLGTVAADYKNGEWWLYVPRFARKLTINSEKYGKLTEYKYPIPIEGARTYEMLLDLNVGRYVLISTSVPKSEIVIDGEYVGESPIKKYLFYGTHTIQSQNERYEGSEGLDIGPMDKKELRHFNLKMRDMSDHFGDVVIKADEKTEIYFNNRMVGVGSWKTQLREGSYSLIARKLDCDSAVTNFTVVAQKENEITANEPIAHTGYLRTFMRTPNAKAVYNSNRYLNLEDNNLLQVGTYLVSFSAKGYYPTQREYTVRHNELTTDTVALEKIKYIKPKAFYFGAGYTMRPMGGITALAGVTYKNIDLQASYTFGLGVSDDVFWYNIAEGNDNYQSTMTYKRSCFAVKLGYQIELTERLGITPQVGYQIEQLSGTVIDGTNKFGDGASANCISIGAKLLYAPAQRFYLFAAPEFSIGMSKDNNFQSISDASNITAGGFMISLGAIFNF